MVFGASNALEMHSKGKKNPPFRASAPSTPFWRRSLILEFQTCQNESDSSDSFSDGDEEDQKDYRMGGYHPVEVRVFLAFQVRRSEKFTMTVIKYCVKWVGVSIPLCGWLAI